MTDLTISTQDVTVLAIDRQLPYWRPYGLNAKLFAIDMSGILSGTVKEQGVLQANAIVSVYYRPNGNLVKRVRTDAGGNWSVPLLDKSVADYYAIAQTESAFNAVIYDKLQPV